jgi:hypothetical protein
VNNLQVNMATLTMDQVHHMLETGDRSPLESPAKDDPPDVGEESS